MENQTPTEDSYETYGVTNDFAWYELSEMSNKLRQLAVRFESMERILKARSGEQARYVSHLEAKVRTFTQAQENKE